MSLSPRKDLIDGPNHGNMVNGLVARMKLLSNMATLRTEPGFIVKELRMPTPELWPQALPGPVVKSAKCFL